jgi:hypothetical protein
MQHVKTRGGSLAVLHGDNRGWRSRRSVFPLRHPRVGGRAGESASNRDTRSCIGVETCEGEGRGEEVGGGGGGLRLSVIHPTDPLHDHVPRLARLVLAEEKALRARALQTKKRIRSARERRTGTPPALHSARRAPFMAPPPRERARCPPPDLAPDPSMPQLTRAARRRRGGRRLLAVSPFFRVRGKSRQRQG